MKGFKISTQKKKAILNDLNFVEKVGNNFTFFFAKQGSISIHLYSNNTILLQGDETEITNFLKKYQPKETSVVESKQLKISTPYFGCDESGVGDLFGPIVLTVFYLDEKIKPKLQTLSLADSKQMSEKNINKIAPLLMENKNYFCTKIISNSDFNKLHGVKMNLKELLTYYYANTIAEFAIAPKSYTNIVIDGFVSTSQFQKYCQKLDLNFNEKVVLVTKSENKHLAVAAASIISRFVFLQEIKKIENKLARKILLGASDKTKALLQELIKTKIDPSKISKTGYKRTINKITETKN